MQSTSELSSSRNSLTNEEEKRKKEKQRADKYISVGIAITLDAKRRPNIHAIADIDSRMVEEVVY